MFDELIDFCKKVFRLSLPDVVEGVVALIVAAAMIQYALLPILFGH